MKYELPTALLQKEESTQQTLQRAIVFETGLSLSKVVSFVGHIDAGKNRQLIFLVNVSDPMGVQLREHVAYAWPEMQEAIGYPISDELREILNRYL